jgi:hypothetical protein
MGKSAGTRGAGKDEMRDGARVRPQPVAIQGRKVATRRRRAVCVATAAPMRSLCFISAPALTLVSSKGQCNYDAISASDAVACFGTFDRA